MSKYVAAIDQGTTSTRCIIFDHDGQIVGVAQKEHRQIFPEPGLVEHDPVEIWENTQAVIREVVESLNLQAGDIVAVGITNQRETTMVWDRNTGKPYYNAIVWQDTRTDKICNRLAGDYGQDRFREKVGLPLATYFSGPKLKWLLDNVDGLRRAADDGDALFGTLDSWLVWNLTGGVSRGAHVTDVTNASRTMLMDLKTLDWDDEIMETMGIPHSVLPVIVPSSDPNTWGKTMRSGPFGDAIPVCGILGDQQAALMGQACTQPGEAKNTYGTGCFMLLNTGTEIVQSTNGLLTTVAYRLGNDEPVYALEGSIAISGALVQWLRDNLNLISTADEVEALARTVDDNGGIYFVPAFSGLYAPYWQGDARGVIAGMTRFVNKGHIARATLEATAFQTREVLDAMVSDSGVELQSLKVDGGMVRNELLMQFQADIVGVPVVRPQVTETTALGAAYAAGLAVGFWTSLDELRGKWGMDKQWYPQMDSERREKMLSQWKKAVTRTFGWVEGD
jgi:glycerol kinase